MFNNYTCQFEFLKSCLIAFYVTSDESSHKYLAYFETCLNFVLPVSILKTSKCCIALSSACIETQEM